MLAGKVAGLVVVIQRFVFEESDSDFGRVGPSSHFTRAAAFNRTLRFSSET